MIEKAARELIHDRIDNNNWGEMEHVILSFGQQSGVCFLLNHACRDSFKMTENVSPDLLEKLAAFRISFPEFDRVATIGGFDVDQTRIWPRTNRTEVFLKYETESVSIALPDETVAFLWSVFIPARRNEGDVAYFVLSYNGKSARLIETFLTLLLRLHSEVHASAKHINVHKGSDIQIRGEHRWEDLTLTDEILSAVKDDLEFWIASEELYLKRKIPYRRGYLFEGPPGNGKTAVARTILSTYDFSAHSFNFSDVMANDKDLQRAFTSAVDEAPAVFLLEDIDRIFDDSSARSRITKEGLFNCLDGVSTNTGLVVIATANHPEVLDAAIRHRPGRFDVPVRFGNPEFPQRQQLLRRLLGDDHTVSSLVVDQVASGCKGMSMAFIKLVYETAAAKAFKRREEGITITEDDLLNGFQQAKGYYTQMETSKDRKAGFTRNEEEVPTPAGLDKAYSTERIRPESGTHYPPSRHDEPAVEGE